MKNSEKTLDMIVNLCKNRGFIYPGSEIYGGLANTSALLYERLTDINWAGFYLLEDDTLVLGPFQGKIACVRIPVGRGVCGTAVARNQVQRIEDVHVFDGHIACDAASNSEIVLPLVVKNQIIGVLDIDSTVFGRFTDEDGRKIQFFPELCRWQVATLRLQESCLSPVFWYRLLK